MAYLAIASIICIPVKDCLQSLWLRCFRKENKEQDVEKATQTKLPQSRDASTEKVSAITDSSVKILTGSNSFLNLNVKDNDALVAERKMPMSSAVSTPKVSTTTPTLTEAENMFVHDLSVKDRSNKEEVQEVLVPAAVAERKVSSKLTRKKAYETPLIADSTTTHDNEIESIIEGGFNKNLSGSSQNLFSTTTAMEDEESTSVDLINQQSMSLRKSSKNRATSKLLKKPYYNSIASSEMGNICKSAKKVKNRSTIAPAVGNLNTGVVNGNTGVVNGDVNQVGSNGAGISVLGSGNVPIINYHAAEATPHTAGQTHPIQPRGLSTSTTSLNTLGESIEPRAERADSVVAGKLDTVEYDPPSFIEPGLDSTLESDAFYKKELNAYNQKWFIGFNPTHIDVTHKEVLVSIINKSPIPMEFKIKHAADFNAYPVTGVLDPHQTIDMKIVPKKVGEMYLVFNQKEEAVRSNDLGTRRLHSGKVFLYIIPKRA